MPQALDAVPHNDRPHDHEIGAAWRASTVSRAFIPGRVDRPCFFYVKQGEDRFRGDYGLLMAGNVPRASYNMARIFNGLRGQWLAVDGVDDDASAVASWDEASGKLSVVLVNLRDRYGLRRPVEAAIAHLHEALVGGGWKEWVVDAAHSHVWNNRANAELTGTDFGSIDDGRFLLRRPLPPNSVTWIELSRGSP